LSCVTVLTEIVKCVVVLGIQK